MVEKSQSKTWIVLIVAIISTAAVICVVLLIFGIPFARILTERYITSDDKEGLVLRFDGSYQGTAGEQGFDDRVSFVPGHTGQGILFNNEDSLHYFTDNNIKSDQGIIEFWLKPNWDGDDNQSYVFFEIGDSWFNRFRILKDGANNFRFMVWSSKNEYDAACNVSSWAADEWHHVRVDWRSDTISLHLDGILCDTQTFVVMPNSLSSTLYIGSSANQDLQAQSVIDEFMIYPEP